MCLSHPFWLAQVLTQRHNIDSLWDKKSHLPAVESDTLEYLKLQLLWLLRLTRDAASFSSLFSFTLECTLWMSQSRVLVSIGEWLTYMQPSKICTVSPYTQNIGIRGALWLKCSLNTRAGGKRPGIATLTSSLLTGKSTSCSNRIQAGPRTIRKYLHPSFDCRNLGKTIYARNTCEES